MWRRAPGADDGRVTEIIAGLSLSPLEILVVSSAVALVPARWLPPAARWRVTVVAAALLVPSALVLGLTGVRWQLLPVLAGAGCALPFA
ncbi:collagen alpha-5(VI) chain, partial [Streptomyces sp. RSD-27]